MPALLIQITRSFVESSSIVITNYGLLCGMLPVQAWDPTNEYKYTVFFTTLGTAGRYQASLLGGRVAKLLYLL